MSGTIVITGGCGFLGAALARFILAHGLGLPDGRHLDDARILLLDQPGAIAPNLPRTTCQAVNIADEAALDAATPQDAVIIYHLAAVVSGQAEAEPDLAHAVNVGGAKAVLNVAAARGGIPVVGTSSIAVYGGTWDGPLTEATAIQPTNTYGVTKAIAELLMADARRRGWADSRTLRLPTVTVRPGKPNAAASSFASSIIREPLAGETAICPVDIDLRLWVCSPENAVKALHHAARVPTADWPHFGAVNVPGLTVSVQEMLEALEPHDPAARALVSPVRNEQINAIVSGWPKAFDCALARKLGFAHDAGFGDILKQAITANQDKPT